MIVKDDDLTMKPRTLRINAAGVRVPRQFALILSGIAVVRPSGGQVEGFHFRHRRRQEKGAVLEGAQSTLGPRRSDSVVASHHTLPFSRRADAGSARGPNEEAEAGNYSHKREQQGGQLQ